MARLPVPPVDLANRVGPLVGPDGSFDRYQAVGRELRDIVVGAVPSGWDWHGKAVLDFGCGAGRTLRHFADEASDAEFCGCDIDAESVDWLNANLNPPFRAFVNREQPPLPFPDRAFDLIYAFSVFTHITAAWIGWVLELHRLLKPDGVLIASFLGEGMSEDIAGEPWVEDRVGMNVLHATRGWDAGGPVVLLSPWWIREHWGRAFDIDRLDPGASPGRHGLIVARPAPTRPSPAELERIAPTEQREVAALRHNVLQLQREAAMNRAELASTIDGYESSRSWRLTAPLRLLGRRARAMWTRIAR